MSSEKPNFLSQPVVKSLFVYRNGDPYYEARRIVINQKRVCTFETLLREVTGGIQAPFGAVRNIYTPRGGHKVECLDSLQSGEQYVAAGRERFKKLDYLQIGSRKKRMMQTLPMPTRPVPHSRIIVSARFLKPIKEPCAIFVVANGDVINPAVRLLIHQKMLGQFDRILEMITERMGLRCLGGVRSLYTFEGQQVTDGKQLESGQLYVAVGRERFKKLPYSDLLFPKPRGARRLNGMKTSSLPPIYRFSKTNGNGKSVVRSSDSGDSKTFPPAQPGNSKEQLSSIVREISQARLITLRKRRSRQSMSLSTNDNGDLYSKGDDGNTEDKTPQDQPVEEKPVTEDILVAEEKETVGEKEESAAENAPNEDKEEGGNQEPNTKTEGEKEVSAAENAPKEDKEEGGNQEPNTKTAGEKEESAAENAPKEDKEEGGNQEPNTKTEGEKEESAAENAPKEDKEEGGNQVPNIKTAGEKEESAAENASKEDKEEGGNQEPNTKIAGEKEESAAENASKEDKEEGGNQEPNTKIAGEKEESAAENAPKEDKEEGGNQEPNTKTEGEIGTDLVNGGGDEKEEEEEVKEEVKEEVRDETNKTVKREEQEPSDHTSSENDESVENEQKAKESGEGERESKDLVNGVNAENGGKDREKQDEPESTQTDNKTKESDSSGSSSSNSNQEEDATNTNESDKEESGEEERKENGEINEEVADEEQETGEQTEVKNSANENGETGGDDVRQNHNETDDESKEGKD